MGTQLGSLFTSLTLESSSFVVGLKKAADEAATNTAKIQKQLSGITTGLKGAAAALGGTAILYAAKQALDYASSLGEVAQQLGVTSKDLQEYRYAATQVGIAQETIDKGLAKLTLTMGQARDGVEKPKAAFEKLSELLGKDVLKSAQTAGDAIPLISDALAKVKDPAQRAALEVALFGKAGQQLDTLLSGGSGAINELRDAAHALGLVLSEDQIQNADKTADKLAEVQKVLEANLAKTVADNSEAIFGLANAFEALAVGAANVLQNVMLARNVRGMMVGGDYNAAQELAKTQQGRVAAINALNAKLQENSSARAAGTGDTAALDRQFKVLNRLRNSYVNAERAAARLAAKPKPSAPNGAGAGSGSGGGRSGGGGTSSAEKADRNRTKQTERFNAEMESLTREQWNLESDLTNDTKLRADFARKRVDLEATGFAQELQSKVKLGELTEVQAKKLQLGKNYNANLERDLINQQSEDATTRAALDTKDAGLRLNTEMLRGDLSLVQTQAERRAIELKLLDLEYERQRAALEAVLALNSSTEAEKEIARARLAQLDTMKARDAEGVRRDTAGPMERFGNELHRTAGQIKEDFEQIQVDGIKSLNDGLVDAIMNSKSLGDVFSNVADQIIADLIRIAIREAESAIFGGGSGGGGGGGFFGNLLSSLGSLFGGGQSSPAKNAASFSLPGFANGGSFQIGGKTGIDRNVLAINGIPKARVGYGERLTITPANDRTSPQNSVVRVVVSANDYFDAHVTGIAGDVAAEAVGRYGKAQSKVAARRMGLNGQ